METVPSSLNKFGLKSEVELRGPWVDHPVILLSFETHIEKDFTDLGLRLGEIRQFLRL